MREEGLHFGASYIEHLEFQAAIASGRAAVTPEEGMKSVMMGIAAQQSIVTGAPVFMNDL